MSTKSRTEEPRERFDIYQTVTDQVIAALEAGIVPWRKPWTEGDGVHINLHTKKPYRGINQFLLGLTMFGQPYWMTVRQANEHGGTVRKGERSTMVVLWKPSRKPIRDGQPIRPGAKIVEEDGKRYELLFMLRFYRVFNVEQIDGLPDGFVPQPAEREPVPMLDECEKVLADYVRPGDEEGPALSIGGSRAAYQPAIDLVKLPHRDAFQSAEHFYATAFHECVHSTGHPERLNRPGVADFDKFGSEQYGKEELVAEMGAAMLCAMLRIDTTELGENTAAYIGSWLNTIKGDKKLVLQAAGAAQTAADWVLAENAPRLLAEHADAIASADDTEAALAVPA